MKYSKVVPEATIYKIISTVIIGIHPISTFSATFVSEI